MLAELRRESIVGGMQKVIAGLPQKGTLPILSYVRMKFKNEKLILETTDLDVFMQWEVPCDSLEGEMDLCIPMKRLYGILRDLSVKQLTIKSLDTTGLRVITGTGDYKFFGLESSEFPAFPSFEEDTAGKVECGRLKQLLDKTLYCVGSSETREVLNGLLLMMEEGLLRSVSTDGRRLATDVVSGTFSGDHTMIMPRKAMTAVRSCLDSAESDTDPVELLFGANHGAVKMANGTVLARLLDGSFPDYRDVIPSNPTMELKLSREGLLSASRRIGLFSGADGTMIKIIVSQDRVTLCASSSEIGEASEVVDIQEGQGSDLELGINYRYVGDALSCVKDQDIFMDLIGSRRPMCIRGTDGYRAVIMPMRLEGAS